MFDLKVARGNLWQSKYLEPIRSLSRTATPVSIEDRGIKAVTLERAGLLLLYIIDPVMPVKQPLAPTFLPRMTVNETFERELSILYVYEVGLQVAAQVDI